MLQFDLPIYFNLSVRNLNSHKLKQGGSNNLGGSGLMLAAVVDFSFQPFFFLYFLWDHVGYRFGRIFLLKMKVFLLGVMIPFNTNNITWQVSLKGQFSDYSEVLCTSTSSWPHTSSHVCCYTVDSHLISHNWKTCRHHSKTEFQNLDPFWSYLNKYSARGSDASIRPAPAAPFLKINEH